MSNDDDFIAFQQQPRKASRKQRKGQKQFVKAAQHSFTDLVEDYLENCDDFDDLKLLKTTLQPNISDSEDSDLPQENQFSSLMAEEDNDDANWQTDSNSSDISMNSNEIILSMQESKLDDLKGETEFIIRKAEEDDDGEDQGSDQHSNDLPQLSVWTDDELTHAALELGLLKQKSKSEKLFLKELIQEIDERGLDLEGEEDGFKQGHGSTFWAKSIHDPKRAKYEMRELEREMKYKDFSDTDDNSDDSLDDKLSRAARKREKKKASREKRLKLQQQDLERKDLVKNLGSVLEKNRKTVGPEMIQYLTTINIGLQKFCNDPRFGDVHLLPPMPSAVRKLAIEMCKAYNTNSKTRGSGKKKTVMVYRTGSTSVPGNWKTLVYVIAGRGSLLQGTAGIPKPKNSPKKSAAKSKSSDTGPKVGDVVGSKAAVINDDNLGHKMMRMMGWSPGESLGKDGNGIMDPIKVVIRSKKAGLGQE